MSDTVSALGGRTFAGFVTVEEIGPTGMISLRGDLADPVLAKAVKAAVGLGLPGPRGMVSADGRAAGWMSPDEVLLLMPYGAVPQALAVLTKGLMGKHYLATDVSDARAVFRIRGAGVRDVLAKLTPTDLSPAAFTTGMLRRTRLAQVAAAFWISGEDEFTIVSFRSVAEYVFGLLEISATKGGEVGFHGN